MQYLRKFRYLTLLATFVLIAFTPAKKAEAQVRFGIGVGLPYGPPVCAYGYYPYYPYACAPYGYYGPDWFYGGVFIGAGPWFRGGYYGRGYGYGGYYGGYRGAYGYRGNGYRGGVPAYPRGGYAGGYRGGAVSHSGFAVGSHFSGGGGLHGGGGGGAHFSGHGGGHR
jgi:hypothetical protein